jgi:hypothetical protein
VGGEGSKKKASVRVPSPPIGGERDRERGKPAVPKLIYDLGKS